MSNSVQQDHPSGIKEANLEVEGWKSKRRFEATEVRALEECSPRPDTAKDCHLSLGSSRLTELLIYYMLCVKNNY